MTQWQSSCLARRAQVQPLVFPVIKGSQVQDDAKDHRARNAVEPLAVCIDATS